jgi:outer membrane protein assembly factor BamB
MRIRLLTGTLGVVAAICAMTAIPARGDTQEPAPVSPEERRAVELLEEMGRGGDVETLQAELAALEPAPTWFEDLSLSAPEPLWCAEGEWAERRPYPTVAEGRVFVGDSEAIAALDETRGDVLWTTKLGDERFYRVEYVDAERVVIQRHRPDRVVTLDLASGEVLWSRDQAEKERVSAVWAGIVLERYSDESDGQDAFVALALGSGEELWRFRLPAYYGNLLKPAGETLIIETHEEIVGVDATTGEERWRRPRKCQGAVLADGRFLTQVGERICALDVTVGEPQWCVENAKGFKKHVFDGDRIYVITWRSEVIAIDTATGSELWRAPADMYGDAQAVHTITGRVLVRSGQVFMALDPDTGDSLWDQSTDLLATEIREVPGAPVLVLSGRKAAYGIDPETGRFLWDCALEPKTDAVMGMGSELLFVRRQWGLDSVDLASGVSLGISETLPVGIGRQEGNILFLGDTKKTCAVPSSPASLVGVLRIEDLQLLQRLAENENTAVRTAAFDVLASHEAGLDTVFEALYERDLAVRFRARSALARGALPAARERMLKLATDPRDFDDVDCIPSAMSRFEPAWRYAPGTPESTRKDLDRVEYVRNRLASMNRLSLVLSDAQKQAMANAFNSLAGAVESYASGNYTAAEYQGQDAAEAVEDFANAPGDLEAAQQRIDEFEAGLRRVTASIEHPVYQDYGDMLIDRWMEVPGSGEGGEQ